VARSAVTCIAGSLVVLATASSACDGKLIHLGDGKTTVDGGNCPHAQVNANQVLWIGDSWVLIPGSQHMRVRDSARAAEAIGPDDDYVMGAVAAADMDAIANQYASQEAGATKVKVLIMDGGTWDTIVANGSAASVASAASSFSRFLGTVASDATVEHIVYFLMPELVTIPGVAALRPLLQPACAQSVVPCHFIDLQPIWVGHPEYTANEGTFASDEGAGVLAGAIWATMQQNCIAQ
jgi:hypothetical protein